MQPLWWWSCIIFCTEDGHRYCRASWILDKGTWDPLTSPTDYLGLCDCDRCAGVLKCCGWYHNWSKPGSSWPCKRHLTAVVECAKWASGASGPERKLPGHCLLLCGSRFALKVGKLFVAFRSTTSPWRASLGTATFWKVHSRSLKQLKKAMLLTLPKDGTCDSGFLLSELFTRQKQLRENSESYLRKSFWSFTI